ncbi:amino acid ABC transporter permease protein [Vibrio maritimus]|uniref:Amino acid ABC transporter permease protein n=1 Tax=Vibrio maritimus TaxID=990268 RepID=A0A090TBT9_9VIBR|nr:amino acid ABC transporter permease protein [Vibrio maritimus]
MSNTNSIKLNSNKKHPSPAKRWRPSVLDGILLLAVAGLVAWLAYRSSIGINYHWRWSQAFELVFNPTANGGLPYFVQGIIATLRLSMWGMVLAVTLGTLLGLAKHSAMAIFSIPANLFIQLVRNIPPLVFIFIFYFFISNQLIPLLGLVMFSVVIPVKSQVGRRFCLALARYGRTYSQALSASAFCHRLMWQKSFAQVWLLSQKDNGRRVSR